jgi:hypothetical protein
MAQRRLLVPLSAVLVTVKVESIWRPSSGSTTNRRQRSSRRWRRVLSSLRWRNKEGNMR